MNQDRAKGTIDKLVRGAKRKTGCLTGITRRQAAGTVQQLKCNLENAWGKAKDAIPKAGQEAEMHPQTDVKAKR